MLNKKEKEIILRTLKQVPKNMKLFNCATIYETNKMSILIKFVEKKDKTI